MINATIVQNTLRIKHNIIKKLKTTEFIIVERQRNIVVSLKEISSVKDNQKQDEFVNKEEFTIADGVTENEEENLNRGNKEPATKKRKICPIPTHLRGI